LLRKFSFLWREGCLLAARARKAENEYFPLDNSRYHDYILLMTARPTSHAPLEDQLFVAILKAADSLSQEADQLIKAAGLTGAQYNVLRILRGAEPEGLPCSGIGERMISRDPDMTRLLDRMEKHNLITRERQKADRRVIKTRITAEGLKLLKKLDQPVHDLHKKQFRHLPHSRLKQLAELLNAVEKGEPAEQTHASKE
jgi:DNA-binding MarR family transcriptional regulator